MDADLAWRIASAWVALAGAAISLPHHVVRGLVRGQRAIRWVLRRRTATTVQVTGTAVLSAGGSMTVSVVRGDAEPTDLAGRVERLEQQLSSLSTRLAEADAERRREQEQLRKELASKASELRAADASLRQELRDALSTQDQIDSWAIPVLTIGTLIGTFASELADLPRATAWFATPTTMYVALVVAKRRIQRHTQPLTA